jgi:hypothetical protein
MADPTGRWVNNTQWQCPKCAWVNDRAVERCQSCDGSVRPPADEPVRPPDPLDLIGHKEPRTSRPVELATKSDHTLTRVTRDRAVAVIGDSLRTALRNGGDEGDQAWAAISQMSADAQNAALGSVVDDLEREGFALVQISEDGAG